MEPTLQEVLEKAAELQAAVPGAVLVGGTAAALHAGHRSSHDHVLADLAERFDTVLENLEALGGFSVDSVVPGKIILGSLGGIRTGVRQLIRSRPLETITMKVSGRPLVAPTAEEILRIKAWLALSRNQTRDYLDIAALADHMGIAQAAGVLAGIDDYYENPGSGERSVATQLVRQLADPQPRDMARTSSLDRYKDLAPRWKNWDTVSHLLAEVAESMLA